MSVSMYPANYLIFGEGKNIVNTASYGVYISGSGTFGAPERDVDVVSVPGRNGDLIFDNGRFKNVSVSYSCFIASNSFATDIERFRGDLYSLRGYHRLEDTYHPYEYRIGRVSGAFEPSLHQTLEAATATLEFDCKPQRFLKAGDSIIDNPTKVINPTKFAARPVIKVNKPTSITVGDNTLYINDFTSETSGYIVIDCETMEAYTEDKNKFLNNYIKGSFIELAPGDNSIANANTDSDFKLIPHWWTI